MKKFFILCALLLTVYGSTSKPAHATLPTFDYGNFFQAIVSYVQDGLTYAKESITSAATVTGSAQQTLETVNNNYLIPARDTLTIIAMVKSTEMMQNLVLGSLGVDPLLVRNPENYVKGKGEEVVKSVLEDPQIKQSMYDASVMGSVISAAKDRGTDLKAQVRNINQSSIPAIEQKARCTDNALSSQARKDMESSGDPYTEQDYITRKREISGALCGNINDPTTKAAVLAASKKSTSWDSWLAQGGGDNSWQRANGTKQAVAARVATVEGNSAEDLKKGNGIRSEQKCIKRTTPSDNTSPCLKYSITKPGSVISNSFNDSISNPLKLQLAGFGKGAGNLISSAASVAGTAFTTINLLKSLDRELGGGSSGSGSSGNTFTNNAPVTTVTAPIQDLANNSAAKNAITKTPKDQMQNHKKSLTDLILVNDKIIATADLEKSNLDSIKSCFEGLATEFPEYTDIRSSTRFTDAMSFYDRGMAGNNEQRRNAINEKNLAILGNNFITTTLTKIDASRSSEEILNLFLTYQDELKRQNIPDSTALLTRNGDYVEYSLAVKQSTQKEGDILKQTEACTSFRQEILLRRDPYGGGAGN